MKKRPSQDTRESGKGGHRGTGSGSRAHGPVHDYCIESRHAGAWDGSLRLEGSTFHSPVS